MDEQQSLFSDASGPTNGTGMPGRSISDILESVTDETYELFPSEKYQISMSSVREHLAQIFLLLDQGLASEAKEEISSLPLFLLLKQKDLTLFSLKTCQDFYQLTEEEPLPTPSGRLLKWGIVSSGYVLTVQPLDFPSLANASSLSQILEESPDPKYYLSEEMVKRMNNHVPNRSGTSQKQGTTQSGDGCMTLMELLPDLKPKEEGSEPKQD